MSQIHPHEHAVAIMALVREIAAREDRCAKEWVTRDEFGSWEKRARELSEKTSERRTQLGLSDDAWTNELARILIHEATMALYTNALKKENK